VITLRNIVHGALMLVLNLLAIAGLYLTLESSFLSIVQVLVYAGAIMVLFLFVIMLLGVDRDDLLAETRVARGSRRSSAARCWPLALLFAFVGPTPPASVCGADVTVAAPARCPASVSRTPTARTTAPAWRSSAEDVHPLHLALRALGPAADGRHDRRGDPRPPPRPRARGRRTRWPTPPPTTSEPLAGEPTVAETRRGRRRHRVGRRGARRGRATGRARRRRRRHHGGRHRCRRREG
jgi:hypothetical protein